MFEVPSDATWARAEVFYRDAQDVRREFQPWCQMSNQLFGDEPDSRNNYCNNRIAMQAMTSPIYVQPAATTTSPASRATGMSKAVRT